MDRDKIIKELSKQLGKDERVIRDIVNSPFLFSKKIMMSLEDEHPIRLPRFGVFHQRFGKTKEKRLSLMLTSIVKYLIAEYDNEKGDKELKRGLFYSISYILEYLKFKGFGNEQSIQYFFEWENRIKSARINDTPI